jgi:hypothetical protein
MHYVSQTQNFCKAHLVYTAINMPKKNVDEKKNLIKKPTDQHS